MNLYLGLAHYPVTNKKGENIITSVTNLDIHDIARSCRTFGVEKYFIITPLILQQKLVKRILGHWKSDAENVYNPDRHEALKTVSLAHDIAEVEKTISKIEQKKPLLAVTGASLANTHGDMGQLWQKMRVDRLPCLLLFGTGWGLHPSITELADFCLNPIGSEEERYNHLSVRSAAAIYLDRLNNARKNQQEGVYGSSG